MAVMATFGGFAGVDLRLIFGFECGIEALRHEGWHVEGLGAAGPVRRG